MLDFVSEDTAEMFDVEDAAGPANALEQLATRPEGFAEKGGAALAWAKSFTTGRCTARAGHF